MHSPLVSPVLGRSYSHPASPNTQPHELSLISLLTHPLLHSLTSSHPHAFTRSRFFTLVLSLATCLILKIVPGRPAEIMRCNDFGFALGSCSSPMPINESGVVLPLAVILLSAGKGEGLRAWRYPMRELATVRQGPFVSTFTIHVMVILSILGCSKHI